MIVSRAYNIFLVSFLVFIVSSVNSAATSSPDASIESNCTSSNNENGICKPLKRCPALLSLSRPPVSDENAKLLRESVCPITGTTNSSQVIVCCPTETKVLPEFHLEKNCKSPSGADGLCVQITSCPKINDLFKTPLTAKKISFLRTSQCGFIEKTVYVCCTNDSGPVIDEPTNVKNQKVSTDTPPPDWLVQLIEKVPQPPHCGRQFFNNIFGGVEAKLDEFPWMAILEYVKPSKTVGQHCGGSLINNQFVVTAAHCIKKIPPSWKLTTAILGEWKLSTTIDCEPENVTDCAPPVQRIKIVETIVHPQYLEFSKDQNYDIALLRLKKPAEFTHFVSPICLPIESALWNKDYTGNTFEVSGWGKTEFSSKSDIKMKVVVPFYNYTKCLEVYEAQGKRLFDTQLCVGGESGKDSCNGDSGGPLMKYNDDNLGYWYLAGVVSYGPSQCGTENLPGVYSRVSKYLEWISETI